jgi:hypothetical protein
MDLGPIGPERSQAYGGLMEQLLALIALSRLGDGGLRE